MSGERTSFSAPRREAELRRIEELYEVAKAAHSDKCAECEAAYLQLKMWRDYEQSLVYQRNAMQSALQSLYAALHDLRGMADKGQEDKTNLGGERMTDADVFDLARAELARARARYPHWPSDLVHAAAIASEESGEVVKACNSYHWQQGDETLEDIRAEAVQAIAMWCRFLVGG